MSLSLKNPSDGGAPPEFTFQFKPFGFPSWNISFQVAVEPKLSEASNPSKNEPLLCVGISLPFTTKVSKLKPSGFSSLTGLPKLKRVPWLFLSKNLTHIVRVKPVCK